MTHEPDPRFAQILDRSITPELYREILQLWLRHVTNEEKLFVPHTEEEGRAAMAEMLAAFITFSPGFSVLFRASNKVIIH